MAEITELMREVDYFYEPIPKINGSDGLTVYLNDGKWNICKNDIDNILFGTTDRELFLKALEKESLDLDIFENHLIYSVATRAVLKRVQARNLEKLVGKETVDGVEAGFDAMVNEIKQVLDETTKPNLEVVKGGKE